MLDAQRDRQLNGFNIDDKADYYSPDYNLDFSGYDILDFQVSCDLFNDIAGKSKEFAWSDLGQQYKILLEEVHEINDGLELRDIEEVLDGTVDTLVVALGMLQKLKEAGIDVSKALRKTAENNLTKFPKDIKVVDATVKAFIDAGLSVSVEYNKYVGCYVIKDQNDKIRKPIDFVSNDLKDCIPDKLLKYGLPE